MSVSSAPLLLDPGVFHFEDSEELAQHYLTYGFVVVRGLLTDAELDELEAQCVQAQSDVAAGALDERYGSTIFLDDESKAEPFVNAVPFVNYVEYVQEISEAVRAAVTHPVLVDIIQSLLGPDCWLNDGHRSGVVYQDARPGRESGYTRIGWHSDWQAAPNLDIWPATAFTFHIDETSPANGFLRVVPGSHLWATPAPYRNINNIPVPEGSSPVGGRSTTPPPFEMPLGFEKIPGEIPVYVDRGDVILHDAYLWHSAARATDDATTRRHVRGGYNVGDKDGDGTREVFIKNAAR